MPSDHKTHSEDTVLCSCGYAKEEELWFQVSSRFASVYGQWDKERLQKEWSLWPSDIREVYMYYREIALDKIDDKLLVANLAADKALEFRRNKATHGEKEQLPQTA